MADIRINSLSTTATSFNANDYIVIDGATGGTRKMLAANPPFTDVTLGSGGPSVKSSLDARAARQGLVFDGSSVVGASATLSTTIGTSDFSTHTIFTVPTANPSDATTVFNICAAGGFLSTGRAFNAYITPTGLLVVRINGATSSDFRYAAINTNAVSTYGGKLIALSTVRSGSTLSVYINGVSAAYTETTGGTVPAWSDTVNGAFCFVGSSGGDRPLTGTIFGPYIYNRALSAAEVVSLFEAGVPAGADYNSASNTVLNTGTALNTYSTAWTTFTGASATGFTASTAANSVSPRVVFPLSGTLVAGRKYRAKITTSSSGLSSLQLYQSNTGYGGLGYIANLPAGSSEYTFTASSGVDALMVITGTDASGSHSLTVSGVNLDTPGLLLAPDAGQAGGGLAWYDTSGNAANITLPASGVSWNVPSSQKTASGWTYGGNLATSGNLTVSGTGTSSVAGKWLVGSTTAPSGGSAAILAAASVGGGVQFANTVANNGGLINAVNGAGLTFYSYTGALGAESYTELARFVSGNLLLGTTTDSGNGKLQVGTNTTTSAGGIGFGTDTSLYRTFAGTLALNGSNPNFKWVDGSTIIGEIQGYSNDFYISARNAGSNLFLRTNGTTTALTLDSSQNATFAGTITPKASTGSAVFALDTVGQTFSVANNGTATPMGNANNFSGMIIVNDTSVTGAVAVFITGANLLYLVSQTGSSFTLIGGTAGKTNVYLNGSVLTIENKQGSACNYNVMAFRTRQNQ